MQKAKRIKYDNSAKLRRCFIIVRVVCKIWVFVFKQRIAKARLQLAYNQNPSSRSADDNGNLPCWTCKELKYKDHFYEYNKGKGYFRRNCKSCNKKKRNRRAEPQNPKPLCRETRPGHKQCTKCFEEKQHEQFNKLRESVDGLASHCRSCSNKYLKLRRQNLLVSLERTLQTMKSHLPDHMKQNKQGLFDLTVEAMLDLYEASKGRCKISGLTLGWQPHSLNRLSPERVDSGITYTVENTVLIAIRFNTPDLSCRKDAPVDCGSSQWNKTKWIEFHRGYNKNHCKDRHQKLRVMFDKKQGYVRTGKVINRKIISSKICPVCGWEKHLAEFSFEKKRGAMRPRYCLNCDFINLLLKACKLTNREMSCDLTDDSIRAMIFQQNGLCAVSRHEMSFRKWSDFKCSIERIDNNGGHTLDNCYLICSEFQTGDTSRHCGVDPEEVVETAQWTSEIYQKIFWPCGIPEDPLTWKTL